jgi:hypothetical protein
LASPLYFAVIVAVEETLVARVACNEANAPVEPEPAVPAYVTVPLRGVEPFMNCTVPDGATPLLSVLTVEVRVRLEPGWTLDALVLMLVEVAAGVMPSVTGLDALAW